MLRLDYMIFDLHLPEYKKIYPLPDCISYCIDQFIITLILHSRNLLITQDVSNNISSLNNFLEFIYYSSFVSPLHENI